MCEKTFLRICISQYYEIARVCVWENRFLRILYLNLTLLWNCESMCDNIIKIKGLNLKLFFYIIWIITYFYFWKMRLGSLLSKSLNIFFILLISVFWFSCPFLFISFVFFSFFFPWFFCFLFHFFSYSFIIFLFYSLVLLSSFPFFVLLLRFSFALLSSFSTVLLISCPFSSIFFFCSLVPSFFCYFFLALWVSFLSLFSLFFCLIPLFIKKPLYSLHHSANPPPSCFIKFNVKRKRVSLRFILEKQKCYQPPRILE